ncbi:MAG: pyridoxal 5'-phosphate synthase glutaminase subunit PdxT [Eubacteriales bacterium]|nr:pyridoxal 5'-phosphate synthase glutaminase subunit PdxT [Lachnospiraceae bacterium]MDO5126329.1 pyridoxal 5'-phosphate synthase glutaminase subunit PdxT [Eubacteriales bacterium]
MKIGVIAVQGAFIEHEAALQKLGIESIELRQKSDTQKGYDGLILPGGESTVQGKLLKELDMFDTIKTQIESGMPVLATCAGMILLANELSNDAHAYFQTIPMTVKRNAYGRQLGSFHTEADFCGIDKVPMTFIRAPYVETVSPDVEILAKVQEKIVAVRYKNQIALSFHPELDDDTSIYNEFLKMIA